MIRLLPMDLRAALRAFWKSPGFALLGIGTLAIGIGANSAIFSVINGVLLRPFPVRDESTLVRVTADMPGIGIRDAGLAPLELFDMRDDPGLFSGISGVYPIDANLTGGNEPERVEALLVDINYFDLLGARAEIGRTFQPSDYVPGIGLTAVISDALWKRRFGGDPAVIGRKIRIDEDLFTIIGVMPADFWHPGQTLRGSVELWANAGWSDQPFGPRCVRRRRIQCGAARTGDRPAHRAGRQSLVRDPPRHAPGHGTHGGGHRHRAGRRTAAHATAALHAVRRESDGCAVTGCRECAAARRGRCRVWPAQLARGPHRPGVRAVAALTPSYNTAGQRSQASEAEHGQWIQQVAQQP